MLYCNKTNRKKKDQKHYHVKINEIRKEIHFNEFLCRILKRKENFVFIRFFLSFYFIHTNSRVISQKLDCISQCEWNDDKMAFCFVGSKNRIFWRILCCCARLWYVWVGVCELNAQRREHLITIKTM